MTTASVGEEDAVHGDEMRTVDGSGRPAEWREGDAGGTFDAWLARPRLDALREGAIAAAVTAPIVAYPFVFGSYAERNPIALLPPVVWTLLALALWCRAVLMFMPRVRFRIESGRFTFGRGSVPALRTASLRLTDLVTVRATSRSMTFKFRTFDVWDLVVETRDGASHRVKLSWGSAEEAAWMARRVATAAGLTPCDA